ncbi:MAG: HAD hydrolase-like protein, partial [Lachnospiraceae bacterium]|nr:HAD hydrolase-like protein [Lachnospiraceae bacterium]
NTLVMHGAPATPEAAALFEKLRGIGLNTCLISNNSAERVAPFAEAVGSRFMSKAGKPSRRGYMEAMRLMGTNAENTLFVGDQLFTDIWGANRCGIRTVLVNPIHPREEIQIVLKRFLEKPVLAAYERKKRRTERS